MPQRPEIKGRTKNPLDRARPTEIVWQQVAPMFDAVRIYEPGITFVYFIGQGEDGPVKIGLAKDPIARVRNMQTGNPQRLRIEYLLIGGLELERLLHEFWAKFSIRAPSKWRVDAHPGTEWFRAEIRETLYPIIDMAAERQRSLISMTEPSMRDLERAVREAHIAHDFVAQGRDEVRLLRRTPPAPGERLAGGSRI